MKIAFLYAPVAFGHHREPLDWCAPEESKSGLTGTDAICVNYAREMAFRGHEVAIYCHGVEDPEGEQMGDDSEGHAVMVLPWKMWAEDSEEAWDAVIATSNPNALAEALPSALRVVNRQVAAFGIDTFEYETFGYDKFVDLYLVPSESSKRHVTAPLPPEVAAKFQVLPDGCYPEMFGVHTTSSTNGETGETFYQDHDLEKKPGQVAYVSSPDRGLHLLLSVWPEIRKAVPHAKLVIAYQSLDSWMTFHTDPAKRMGGPVDEECTRRALYIRHALRKLEGYGVRRVGGGMSHRDIVRLLSESEVFAYPCDPLAYTETFSVATLEACAAGCLPVISAADCLAEVHGAAAAVVPMPIREHLGDFTRHVIQGLKEPRFREKFAELGREHAELHDWRKLAEKLELMLEQGIRAKNWKAHIDASLDRASDEFWKGTGDTDPARVQSLEKPRIDLVLTPYASGTEPIDIDRPFDSNSGGGCRAGFMGLVRELPRLGYDVRAYSTFKGDLPRHDRKSEPSYHAVSEFKPDDKRDVLLAYYDTSPLVGVSGCLRVASHHTFNIPCVGAFEWTDVNLAPSQYAADALERVFDQTAPWYVMPNAVQPDLPEWKPVPGRCVFHTSASRGLWNLFEAWPEIRRQVPNATLHIVGDVAGWLATYEGVKNRQGEAAARTRAAIKNLGDTGVTFLSRLSRKEMLRELSEASCFPFPFEAPAGPCETFSVSMMECMALGVPVVYVPGDALAELYGLRGIATSLEEFPRRVIYQLQLVARHGVRDGEWREDGEWARGFTFEASAKALDAAIRENLPHRKWTGMPELDAYHRAERTSRTEPGFRPDPFGKGYSYTETYK